MLLIRAIVRPEKSTIVLKALFEAGFPAVTKMAVFGRGKQRGLKVGNITYDADKDFVITTIIEAARTDEKGAFGDGKIFVTPITETYTISTGAKEA